MTGLTRRALAALPLVAAFPIRGRAAPARTVRIGVLNDASGGYADSSGAGSVASARLAAEEMAATGLAVEIVSADHQNSPDVGAAIAREWFDRGGVDAVADLGNSAVALAVSSIARAKDKACLVSTAGVTALTGAQCSPNTVQWTYDTYAQTTSLTRALAAAGKKTWFFITADYTFGQSLQGEATAAIKRLGGSVVGSVRHPLGTNDFSSYLLQAQASGADVVAFANGGGDTTQCAQQAHEFGLSAHQTLVGLSMLITDVNGLGLDVAQGLLVTETFYWDLNAGTRLFADRWTARIPNRRPTMMQAGVYGVVLHYLKAVNALGRPAGGAEIVRKMKVLPTDDPAFGKGTVRIDGRTIHDNYVFRVKAPAASHGPWDYYTLLDTVPGDQAFRPVADGGCPLLASMSEG